MSEFTSGNIILKGHRKFVEDIVQDAKIKEINDKYDVFLTNDYYIFGSLPTYIVDISKSIPILYFYHAEDHGWGFRIIFNGEVVALLDYSYDIEYGLFLEIAQERYPDEAPQMLSKEVTNAIYEEISNLAAYKEQYDNQFRHLNLQQFELFNVDIPCLEKIFKNKYLNDFDIVKDFKKIVGIEEMEWVSYNYE